MVLPFLALSREPGEALYQAIPGFLDWGHTAVYTFAALFVIFFGCASSAFEIRDRQVWSVVTKPVSHGGWLLGKWLGTLTLGMTIVAGGFILMACGTMYLSSQKPIDERDARDVRDTVLVGRVGTKPVYQEPDQQAIREAVDQDIAADSVLKADIENGAQDEAEVRRTLAAQKRRQFLDQQRQIPPGDSREFTFAGLRDAVSVNRGIALRYKFHGGGDDEHQRFPAMIQYASGKGAGGWELREWVPSEVYTLPIDPRFVDDDGTLRLRIFSAGWDEKENKPVPGTITMFMLDDSLEVMVDDSSFAGNLLSAAFVDLCKLGFLAALAVAAGSLLSFPIAVLLAFGVFAMATLTPFLAVSIKNYYPDQKSGLLIWAFQEVVLGIAAPSSSCSGASPPAARATRWRRAARSPGARCGTRSPASGSGGRARSSRSAGSPSAGRRSPSTAARADRCATVPSSSCPSPPPRPRSRAAGCCCRASPRRAMPRSSATPTSRSRALRRSSPWAPPSERCAGSSSITCGSASRRCAMPASSTTRAGWPT
jgi:hypothetical protein